LFVGGTRELDSEELETFFGKEFGRVASVRTAKEKFRDGSKVPRGFAFVTFFSERDARQALERQRVNYKKGSVFAKMQVKACDGALKKEDNEYDQYTAKVLREADEMRQLQRYARLTPEEVRLRESKVERTAVVALDCEMVGTGPGGRESQLARVSIVNIKGQSLYSRFVQPVDPVSDYRTRITGLSADQLTPEAGAVTFDEARGVVAAMLLKRIVVGHSLRNDFKVLQSKAYT
jgi:RNA recognition motif-containing protein